MPIQIACPNCGKDYNLADAMNGKNVKCKNCASIFLVGAVAKTPAPTTKPKGTGTAKAPVARTVAVKTSPRRPVNDEVMDVVAANEDDDPDEDDRPLRKSPKKSAVAEQPAKKSSAMLWILLAGGGGAFGFLLLIGCSGGLWWMLSGGAKKIDQEAYDKIRQGMTEAEVNAILGSPTSSASVFGTGRMSVWKQGDNQITVNFDNDKASVLLGSFKDGNTTTPRAGFKTDAVAQSPPPQNPVPQNPPSSLPPQPQPPPPPPNNPPPKTKPANPNPPQGPFKMTGTQVFLNGVAQTKSDIEFFNKDYPVTNKQTITVVAPNGKKATEIWTWINGKGYFKVWFDKDGKIVDREQKDLPQN
jgi:hypothetical protein